MLTRLSAQIGVIFMSIKSIGLLDKKYFTYGKEVYGAAVAENELFEQFIMNNNVKNIKLINTPKTFYEIGNKRF